VRIRFTFLALLVGALAGCASGNTPAHGPAVRSGAFGGAAAVLTGAGGGDAITFDQAMALFGPGAVQLREGRGGLLSYRLPQCALALAFAQDAKGALRLSAVEFGPPTPRDPQPSLEACAAAAQAAR